MSLQALSPPLPLVLANPYHGQNLGAVSGDALEEYRARSGEGGSAPRQIPEYSSYRSFRHLGCSHKDRLRRRTVLLGPSAGRVPDKGQGAKLCCRGPV